MRRAITLIGILVLAIGVLSWLSCNVNKKIKVSIYLSSELAPGEPGEAEIYINNVFTKSTDKFGNAAIKYDALPGDILTITFKKENAVSKSDFSYTVNNNQNEINKILKFKWTPPPPPPPEVIEPREVTTIFEFEAANNLAGISILLDGHVIGATADNGKFRYQVITLDNEKRALSFAVEMTGMEIKTNPQNLNFMTGQKNARQRIQLTGIVSHSSVLHLKFINQADNAPLRNIKIKFSDSDNTFSTDGNGEIIYRIEEKEYNKSVGIEIIEPSDLVITSGYTPIVIRTDMSPQISMELFGKITYVIKAKVKNFSGENLNGVKVVVGDAEYKTNSNGNVSIPIQSLSKAYEITFSKTRYQDFTTSVTPTGNVTDIGTITLQGISATIYVQDSLTQKPIPYVKVIEGGNTLERTNSDGRVQIAVLLNTPMNLEFEPRNADEYERDRRKFVFRQPDETKIVRLLPKPFEFVLTFRTAGGAPVTDVIVNYDNRQYRSNESGKISITRYALPGNSSEQWFEYSFRGVTENMPVDIMEGKKIYEVSKTISTVLNVRLVSNPPGATIKVYNVNHKILADKVAPYSMELEPGIYQMEAVAGQITVNRRVTVSSNNQEVVISVDDPIARIITLYQNQQYQQVVEFYEDPLNQQNIVRTHEKYCDAINAIYISYGKISGQENKHKAVTIGEKMVIENCIADRKPFFLKNLALLYNSIGEWKKADEYYEKANNERYLVPSENRASFSSDCVYYRIVARVEYMRNPGNFSSNTEKCLYLQTTEDLLTEFNQLAVNYGLDYRNSNQLNAMINEEQSNANCN